MTRNLVATFLIVLSIGLIAWLLDVDLTTPHTVQAAEPNIPRPLLVPLPTPDTAAAERDHAFLLCERGHWETHDGATFASYVLAGRLPGSDVWFEASAREGNAWRGLTQMQQTRWLIDDCQKEKP